MNNERTQIISAIWASVLGMDCVGPDDDFFSLGGDSIMATIVTLQVEEALGVMIGADLVFDYPTLAEFSETIGRLANGSYTALDRPS